MQENFENDHSFKTEPRNDRKICIYIAVLSQELLSRIADDKIEHCLPSKDQLKFKINIVFNKFLAFIFGTFCACLFTRGSAL